MKKEKQIEKYHDLIFTFRYVCVDFTVNDEFYSKSDCEKIKRTLMSLTREIVIDKSYVDFKKNKHEKVFMTLEGWNALCKLVIDTHKKSSRKQNDKKIEAYVLIIISYLYQTFEDLGYNINEIYFEVAEDSYFMVEYEKDKTESWKLYPGKWQTWKWFKK